MTFNLLPQQGSTGADMSRPAATPLDGEFTLSIDEALQRYINAGLPRTPRSIQRYCALGHLECRRVDTSFGEKWLVTPASADRHIAYIKEVTPATRRDLSRPNMTGRDKDEPVSPANGAAAAISDETRQAPTGAEASRQVATSDNVPQGFPFIAQLKDENEFLRSQIVVKDTQIKDLTERAKETNHLIAGLQHMLSPLLGSPNGDPQRGDSVRN